MENRSKEEVLEEILKELAPNPLIRAAIHVEDLDEMLEDVEEMIEESRSVPLNKYVQTVKFDRTIETDESNDNSDDSSADADGKGYGRIASCQTDGADLVDVGCQDDWSVGVSEAKDEACDTAELFSR